MPSIVRMMNATRIITKRFTTINDSVNDDNITDTEHWDGLAVRTTFVVALTLIILATVFCNIIVLLTLIRTKRLRTINSVFLANMATVDLIIGLFVMPTALYFSIMAVEEVENVSRLIMFLNLGFTLLSHNWVKFPGDYTGFCALSSD